jgi:hypothetical protein
MLKVLWFLATVVGKYSDAAKSIIIIIISSSSSSSIDGNTISNTAVTIVLGLFPMLVMIR